MMLCSLTEIVALDLVMQLEGSGQHMMTKT